jgi:alkylation response protein AidB-like acyl-CoA dehydrogenase
VSPPTEALNDADAVRIWAREFIGDHDPHAMSPLRFLQARFDAGLAWVHFPVGLGGLGVDPDHQYEVDQIMHAARAPSNHPESNVIGLGMAAPTLLKFGTPDQQRTWLRPLWTGEEIWCQLFSEPGAGSDLASLATSARCVGAGWVVNGQKVWTSLAHNARWALLIARTDPSVPKHRGLTYFVCDMTAAGVEVRALRQLTGESEFNEVFLTDVRIPDDHRLGEVGQGWTVAQATLMNERVAIGGSVLPREGGPIGPLAQLWRSRDITRTATRRDQVLRLWVKAEALRLMSARHGQDRASRPGAEGSGLKLAYAEIAQAASDLELDLLGPRGLLYDDWTETRPVPTKVGGKSAGYRFLRAKGNSIEGGTSEIMRNIIAEKVLKLPAEPRSDTRLAWQDLPR